MPNHILEPVGFELLCLQTLNQIVCWDIFQYEDSLFTGAFVINSSGEPRTVSSEPKVSPIYLAVGTLTGQHGAISYRSNTSGE